MMAKDAPMLTISLLSSGRGKTIERCLASLAPFKEQLPAEILVVDTDPDGNGDVRSILEKYADRIIRFEWRDDFAAARNAGVDAARGEWFLFLDDDEWFLDPQPMIDFLRSEDSHNCYYANQKIRNYFNDDFTDYLDSWVTRLFRLDGKCRFHGRVHEYFCPTKGTASMVPALSGHTGYIYHSREEKVAHVRRNLTLLNALMEEEPRESRWVLQALYEYHALEDTDEQLRLSRKAMGLLDGAAAYNVACVRGYVACNILRIYLEEKEYDSCYREYRKFRGKAPTFGLYGRIYMEIFVAQASYRLGMTKKSRKHCENYLSAYGKYKDKPPRCIEEEMDFLMNTFRDDEYTLMLFWLMRIDIENGTWDSFEQYFDIISWDGSAHYEEKNYAMDLIWAATSGDYDDHISGMVSTFWQYPRTLGVVQNALLAWDPVIGHNDVAAAKAREEFQRSAERDYAENIIPDKKTKKKVGKSAVGEIHQESSKQIENRYWNIVRALAESDMEKGIPLDLLIIWDDHNGARGNMPSYFQRLFANTNPLLMDPLLWRIGIRRGAVLDERIREIAYATWQRYVIAFISESTQAEIMAMQHIMDDIYMGMPDDYYAFFRQQTDTVLAMARKAAEEAAEREHQEQVTTAAQEEMKQIIGKLQSKVEELISAGMMDEAETVMKEIEKYAPAAAGNDMA